jgi:hypothetical protein
MLLHIFCSLPSDFVHSFWANFFSGVLVVFIIFLFKEYINVVDLSGEWEVETQNNSLTYRPIVGMKLFYTIHLIQDNLKLFGSGEKIAEEMNSQRVDYVRSDRVVVKISGMILKNHIVSSKINLSIIENGLLRESRTLYKLKMESNDLLVGDFASTAADSFGTIIMRRVKSNS